MNQAEQATPVAKPNPLEALDLRELRRKSEDLLSQYAAVSREQGKIDDKLRRLFKKWEKALLRSRSLIRRRQKILDEIERRKAVKA